MCDIMARKPNPLTRVAACRCAPASTISFADDVIAGLSALPKRIPPKYFYDNEGSGLFEDITARPNITRRAAKTDSCACRPRRSCNISRPERRWSNSAQGACIKVRFLLDAANKLKAYVPVDIFG